MNIKELESKFLHAQDNGLDIALELTVPGREATEVIIVKHANLAYKLDYYKKNYTEDLVLNRCADIKILKAQELMFNI